MLPVDMNEISYKFPYWGPLVLDVEMDSEVISLLLEKGEESREKNLDHRERLASVINEAYYFENFEWFLPMFNPYVGAYIKAVSDYKINCFKSIPNKWNFDALWINYQKSFEYNPPHNHDGDMSFVIYLQVPEELLKENKKTKGVNNNPGPGMMNFDLGIDKPLSIARMSLMPKVGQAFIFPAWLPHHVYAFKSEVERISVSGNVTFL